MMAPGLPNVAQQYNIQNETVLALTLSVFLISFAIGVRLVRSQLSESTLIVCLRPEAPDTRTTVRDVRSDMGTSARYLDLQH